MNLVIPKGPNSRKCIAFLVILNVVFTDFFTLAIILDIFWHVHSPSGMKLQSLFISYLKLYVEASCKQFHTRIFVNSSSTSITTLSDDFRRSYQNCHVMTKDLLFLENVNFLLFTPFVNPGLPLFNDCEI